MTTTTDVVVQSLTAADADAILDIYQQGMDTGHATFQERAPSWDEWDQSHLETPRLGAFVNAELAGWAALSPTSSRCVYAGVAEESVYVSKKFMGMGIGMALLQAIISASEDQGIWTLTAGIFPENEASMQLHQKAGFKTLGRRERIGKMTFGPLAGQWRDVVTLERRSGHPKFG
ncbi:MAG: N-acetyltransferase family protein [Parasphingorhabdus sp.]|uniref:GNAT family N-acetyltransferase n=1 Tax=Parasphingorhabdus sp. TaxID=2709688 RepID=UPI003298A0F3